MTSREVLPCRQLREYVQLIWCFDLEAGPAGGPPERIAPDGVVELVFHYRDPMTLQLAGGDAATQPRSSAVTLTRRFVEIWPRGSTGLLSVRFLPWGAHHFLDLPVSELVDQVVPAEELWGAAVREIEERLATATNDRRRVALVEEFLLRRLNLGRRFAVEPVVRAIWRRQGDVRVAEICDQFGLTERSLERLFGAAIGVPPKSFIRLTRFLHACSMLRGGQELSLTRLAHDCGYYDQAHCIADVRAFSGMTPRELVAAPAFSFQAPGRCD